MTSKERIKLVLNHMEADRIAIHDALWKTTVKRWQGEGLDEFVEPYDYFDYEMTSIYTDMTFQLPQKTIEETDEYIITQESNGSIRKNWKNQMSTPECIDFLIKDRKTWEEYKPRMNMNGTRINWDGTKNIYDMANERDKFLTFNCGAGYNQIQSMVGSERLLIAIVEDPEWIKDIMETMTNLIIAVAEELMSIYEFDGLFFYDDMGYRNASLFSPASYKEIFFPYHKKIWGFFNANKMPVILHSCGCVKELIPMFIEAGLTCLQPLEVKAGMDLIELKKMYGEKLAFMGGIDARKMKDPDPRVIEDEIQGKIMFAKKGGGYIYHSDHSIPDDVSFPQYCRVIELVKKYGTYKQ
jgi:uroporphyrinogen decarboxylase